MLGVCMLINPDLFEMALGHRWEEKAGAFHKNGGKNLITLLQIQYIEYILHFSKLVYLYTWMSTR
jgi:hypothetical protein